MKVAAQELGCLVMQGLSMEKGVTYLIIIIKLHAMLRKQQQKSVPLISSIYIYPNTQVENA